MQKNKLMGISIFNKKQIILLLTVLVAISYTSCNKKKRALDTLNRAIEISESTSSSIDNYIEERDSIIPLDTISETEALKKAQVKSRKIIKTDNLDYWNIEYFNKNGLLIKHEECGINNEFSDHDTTTTTRLYTYDAKFRLVKRIRKNKDGFIMKTSYTYKKNLLILEENTTDDEPYNEIKHLYDENNRLIESKEKDLKNKDNDWKSTYTYTKNGLLRNKKQYDVQTDKIASLEQFEYNEFGLKTKMITETSLGNQQKEWRYNNFGQVLDIINMNYFNLGMTTSNRKIKTSNYYNKQNLLYKQYLNKDISGSGYQYHKSGDYEVNYQYTFYK